MHNYLWHAICGLSAQRIITVLSMDSIMSVIIILLVLILFPSSIRAIESVPIYSLDLNTIHITAQGTCVSGEVCSNNYTCVDCNSSSFPPENTVDGDSNTKWVSMPSYQNPSLTLDLGQVRGTVGMPSIIDTDSNIFLLV